MSYSKLPSNTTLSPAYRDYKTAKEAKAAFLDGKEFRAHLHGSMILCSIFDCIEGASIILRFCENRKTTSVKVPKI